MKAYADKMNALIDSNASKLGMSSGQYLDYVLNTTRIHLHTLTIAEMIKGYKEVGELNAELAEDGIVDGDKTW